MLRRCSIRFAGGSLPPLSRQIKQWGQCAATPRAPTVTMGGDRSVLLRVLGLEESLVVVAQYLRCPYSPRYGVQEIMPWLPAPAI
jgi:hypothetical protein